MSSGVLTNCQPAGQSGPAGPAREPIHADVPRNDSKTLAVPVVTAASSIQSKNGGLYLPSCSNGRNHHNETAETRPSQLAPASTVRRSTRRVRNHKVGRMRAAPVATAFTPPIRAKANAERLIRQSQLRCDGRTKGNSTQGAIASGHTSIELIDTSDSI